MTAVSKRFGCFYLLSFLLLAAVPIGSLVFGVSMDFAAIGNQAAAESGIPWTSSMLDVGRLALVEPGLWLLIFGASVPMLAALLTLLLFRDFSLTRMLKRLLPAPGQSPDDALFQYGLLILLVASALVITGLFRSAAAPDLYPPTLPTFSLSLVWLLTLGALLDQGALLEEGGWRGYATTLLQDGGISPLKAALIVGVCWSLWHLPRDVVSGLPQQMGLVQYVFAYLPAFTAGTIAASIIASFFMNRLGGSVIPAILVHGLVNDAAGLGGFADINQALTWFHQITKALPMLLVAGGLVWFYGSALGLKKPVE